MRNVSAEKPAGCSKEELLWWARAWKGICYLAVEAADPPAKEFSYLRADIRLVASCIAVTGSLLMILTAFLEKLDDSPA